MSVSSIEAALDTNRSILTSRETLPGPRYVRGQQVDLQADGRRKYPRSRLLASSADRGWSTIYAELRAHPVGTITSAVQQNVEIVIAISGADDGLIVRTGAGRRQKTKPTSGTIWLAPIGIGDEEIMITAPVPEGAAPVSAGPAIQRSLGSIQSCPIAGAFNPVLGRTRR